MELSQLRYFVAVVEEGGFTRAGARLHVSQPGVSAQVAQLERELGQRLLDRSGRRVTPTEAGEAVLGYARAALAAVEGIRRTADAFSGLLRGRVALGLIPGAAGVSVGAFDVVALLGDFHDAHPQVEISLAEDTSERMLAGPGGRGWWRVAGGGGGAAPPPAGGRVRVGGPTPPRFRPPPVTSADSSTGPVAPAAGALR
ncbi:LysR family transcriptional regulator, partial [Streptomyces lavendulae]|uniref:LysR family transcriptional regulator n=1 Tax=Streptomyces lavendulae TaxID=1914 RepID=UPI0036A600DF